MISIFKIGILVNTIFLSTIAMGSVTRLNDVKIENFINSLYGDYVVLSDESKNWGRKAFNIKNDNEVMTFSQRKAFEEDPARIILTDKWGYLQSDYLDIPVILSKNHYVRIFNVDGTKHTNTQTAEIIDSTLKYHVLTEIGMFRKIESITTITIENDKVNFEVKKVESVRSPWKPWKWQKSNSSTSNSFHTKYIFQKISDTPNPVNAYEVKKPAIRIIPEKENKEKVRVVVDRDKTADVVHLPNKCNKAFKKK